MPNPYIFNNIYPDKYLIDYNSEEAYELGVDAGLSLKPFNSAGYPHLAVVIAEIERDAVSTDVNGHGETKYYQGDKTMSPQITAVMEAIQKDKLL